FFMQSLKDRTMIRWGIELRENAKLVGTCGLFAFSDDDKKSEMGYELNRNYQRRGIMGEALTLVLDFAFSSSDMNRIEAFIEPANTASQALADRLGFVKEGEMRDYELCRGKLIDITLWALLRRDWEIVGK
ncbi:MAG: GNAT family N-acetyltransferase, partial [Treponema sp.]|nr:GNAT family N-acetyltransferase [Treponema sp.]